MRIINSGTYRRILLILLLSFETLLIVFAASTFSVSRYISQQEIEGLNQLVVEKLSKNIQYMNDVVNKYCTTVINDDRMNMLLYSSGKNYDNFERIQTLSWLRNMSESYGLIHSTIVYNSAEDTMYSWDENYTTDSFAESVRKKELTVSAPVWRMLPADSYYNEEPVLTYVMYGPFGTDGFVLVNVKTNWLETDLESEGHKDSFHMIVTSDGEVLAGGRNSYFDGRIPDNLVKLLDREYGNIKYRGENGENYAVVYRRIEDSDWMFVSVTLYDVMFNSLNILGRTAITVTVLFGIFGIAVVFFVGKTIYNPLRMIAVKAEEVFGFKNSGKDEIDYLNEVFESESNFDRVNCSVIFKEVFLNGETDKYTFKKALSLSENLKNTDRLVLVYIKSDHISTIKSEFDAFLNETVVMERGRTLAIVAEYNKEIAVVCDKLRNSSVVSAVCVSDVITPDDDVSEVFKKLETKASYRVVYGKEVNITDATVNRNISNADELVYPANTAANVIEAVKGCDLEKAESSFGIFLDEISANSLNNYLVALTKLMISAFEGVSAESPIRSGYMSKKIFEAESREEIVSIFNEAFCELIELNRCKLDGAKETASQRVKTDRIVNSMKMIIDNSYDNSLLCVAAIADEMKLSAGYIVKLFRQQTGITVSDYINKIRIDEAARILSSTNYNIKKVMDMVGYDNESTFYKKFKTYTGMTPKEFRSLNSDSSGFTNYSME